jgi:hypothetical protein
MPSKTGFKVFLVFINKFRDSYPKEATNPLLHIVFYPLFTTNPSFSISHYVDVGKG